MPPHFTIHPLSLKQRDACFRMWKSRSDCLKGLRALKESADNKPRHS